MLHAMEAHDIYISTKTACSSDNSLSLSVLTKTKDSELAKSSIRVSLSYLTTNEEVDEFIKVFREEEVKLQGKRG